MPSSRPPDGERTFVPSVSSFRTDTLCISRIANSQIERQLHSEAKMSSPTKEQLADWRVFLETAYALIDILDAELQAERGITLELVRRPRPPRRSNRRAPHERGRQPHPAQQERADTGDRPHGGSRARTARAPTRRPPSLKVFITPAGLETLQAARAVHRRGVQEHFVHTSTSANSPLCPCIENVREHVRPLRPGRISN